MNTFKPLIVCLCLTILPQKSWAEKEIPVGREMQLTEKAEIVASFKKLDAILAATGPESQWTLYEGLPHQALEAELLAHELKTKETIVRHGFPFYKNPLPLTPADLKALKTSAQNIDHCAAFSGFKGCFGFHPDYSLVWSTGADFVEIQFCFGCDEVQIYHGTSEVYCDMSAVGSRKLKQILEKHRQQRPASRRE